MERGDRLRTSGPPGPLWLSVLSVALIIAAVIGALAATQRLTFSIFGSPARVALTSSLTVSVNSTAGLIAPQGAAFSPDGSRIAVVGAFTPCHQTTPGLPRCGHGLAIYDAHTGALVQVSPIEPLLDVSVPDDTHDAARGAGYVSLTTLGWAPDSTWFGLVYTVFNTSTPTSPDDMLDSGLLLINPQTGATRLIRGDSGYFSALGAPSANHPVWNLTTGAETPSYTPAPGLVFAWNARGLPYPTQTARGAAQTLPANAGPRYPVGQPDGAAPFTIWQPGVLIGAGSAGVGGGRGAFMTTFPSWSADGAHMGALTVGVSLPTPTQATSVVSAPSGQPGPNIVTPDALPAVADRDVALARAQEAIGAFGWAVIAWDPSGGTLASVVCYARTGQSLELRDTTSGAVIGQAALHLSAGDPGCQQAQSASPQDHLNLTLAWSPDGSELLALDQSAATLTLWHVSA